MEEQSRILRALEVLKRACRDLYDGGGVPEEKSSGGCAETDNDPCKSPSMKALLELATPESDGLFRGDPHLSTLHALLSRLRTLAADAPSPQEDDERGHHRLSFLPPFFRRRTARSERRREISLLAGSIEAEIQSWIERETVDRLSSALRSSIFSAGGGEGEDEEEILSLLATVVSLLYRGFDRGLQAALLRSGLFQAAESALSSPGATKRVKDGCAAAVAAMVRFNRDVFVGPVLMGSSVRSLLTMATAASARAVLALVGAIRTPLVDEMEYRGEIPLLIWLLKADPDHYEAAAAAVETVMLVGRYGRKEAVEAMMAAGVVERLVALQRSEMGDGLEGEDGKLVRAGGVEKGTGRGGWWRGSGGKRRRPLLGCVSRFAVEVEEGEGQRREEKAEFKLEVLRRVKGAMIADAEEWNIVAEVLWGTGG